jgi:hypothetical protein
MLKLGYLDFHIFLVLWHTQRKMSLETMSYGYHFTYSLRNNLVNVYHIYISIWLWILTMTKKQWSLSSRYTSERNCSAVKQTLWLGGTMPNPDSILTPLILCNTLFPYKWANEVRDLGLTRNPLQLLTPCISHGMDWRSIARGLIRTWGATARPTGHGGSRRTCTTGWLPQVRNSHESLRNLETT